QAAGEAGDERSDVWALGVLLYHALSGTLYGPPRAPIAARAPWLSSALTRLVDKALANEPDGRYPNASVLAAALRPLARGAEYLAGSRAPFLLPPKQGVAAKATTLPPILEESDSASASAEDPAVDSSGASGSDVDPLIGVVIDDEYTIESRIGEGAMGTVY